MRAVRTCGGRTMANRWIEAVRERGELLVHAGPSFAGGPWAPTLGEAMRTLNGICAQLTLGVRLTECAVAAQATDGADVEVEAAWDHISYPSGKVVESRPFDGRGVEAVTACISVADLVQKAFVFVPAVPKGPESNRTVGPLVRLALLAHELLHAMGAEHTMDDIMKHEITWLPGANYTDDRVLVVTPDG